MRVIRHYARRRISAYLLSAALFAAAVTASSAQLDQWGYWENGVTESWWFSSNDFAKEDAVNAVALWKRIGETKPAAGGEWVGDYFRGSDTHGTYIRWSPEGGFVIAGVNKCEARVVRLTYGKVHATPTVIHFFPEFVKTAAPHGHGHRAPDSLAVMRFVPVEWGGERFLIREDEVGSFSDFVAGLGEYNFLLNSAPYLFHESEIASQFYTKLSAAKAEAASEGRQEENRERTADETETAGEGGRGEIEPPVVPPGYEHFLKKPVEATVTAVGGRRVKRKLSFKDKFSEVFYENVSLTDVTIDAGTEHGLKPGMFLLVREPDWGDRIRIVRAGKRTSTGYVIREVDDRRRETFTDGDAKRPLPKVAVGWKLTTSRF
jgi:hypothetical protein